MFLHVSLILFTGGGGSVPLHTGIHPPGPEAGTPSRIRGRHPLPDQRQAPPPPGSEAGTPPGADTPSTVHAGRYGQQAGGTHPTGMQSCFTVIC